MVRSRRSSVDCTGIARSSHDAIAGGTMMDTSRNKDGGGGGGMGCNGRSAKTPRMRCGGGSDFTRGQGASYCPSLFFPPIIAPINVRIVAFIFVPTFVIFVPAFIRSSSLFQRSFVPHLCSSVQSVGVPDYFGRGCRTPELSYFCDRGNCPGLPSYHQ